MAVVVVVAWPYFVAVVYAAVGGNSVHLLLSYVVNVALVEVYSLITAVLWTAFEIAEAFVAAL